MYCYKSSINCRFFYTGGETVLFPCDSLHKILCTGLHDSAKKKRWFVFSRTNATSNQGLLTFTFYPETFL